MTGMEKMRSIYDENMPKMPFEKWMEVVARDNCPSHFGLQEPFMSSPEHVCDKCWRKALEMECAKKEGKK